MAPLVVPHSDASAPAGDRSDYEAQFPESRSMSDRARRVIAGGTTHDGWSVDPFPVYVNRAEGAFKWELGGRRLIDYWMGHGALLFGHCFPPVVEAVREQATRGSHFGAASDSEVRWAELVCSLIPAAELVRFTSSGTEATMLALRLARAFTGRNLIVKFDGHFHGWHDEALAHFVSTDSAGINEGAALNVAVADPFSVESALDLLEEEEVAAVILEPGGGGSGGLPSSPDFLARLREATSRSGTVLVFDEVVSAFRYSPGGVQQLCGVLPDVTVLAKILCGGLPGGAVAGRREVMDVFGAGRAVGERWARIPHTGTFNGNPLSAAAGVAMLPHVADGRPQERVRKSANELVAAVNEAARRSGVDVHLYNQHSIFHILIGARRLGLPLDASAAVITLYASHPERYASLRRTLLLEGVDTHPIHGWLSTAHDGAVIEATADAFGRAFQRLRSLPEFAI